MKNDGWKIITLKEHFEKILDQKDKAINIALVAAEKASLKTEQAQRDYNATHNDLTRKMEDQYKLMLPRQEADSREKATEEKIAEQRKTIAELTARIDTLAGKGMGINQVIIIIIAIAAIVFAYLKK